MGKSNKSLQATAAQELGATSDFGKTMSDTADAIGADLGRTVDDVMSNQDSAAKKPAAKAKSDPPPQTNQVEGAPDIAGYAIEKKLGEGGMGAVYKATQINLQRAVALKVMSPHLGKNKDFVSRFYREARSSAALDHPNVVRGYDVGESNGIHFFAMELVEGRSAQSILDESGKLSPGDALKIIYDVALALEHAEEHKMVHRDIKPDNIMITNKGVVKLADLGLAKQMDDENSMTQTGSGFGTPYYMPPEQAKNAKYVDARSDIYALGATLYHLLTGKVPFGGTTAMEVLLAKEKGTFPKPSTANPDVPSQVNLLCDKMMAKLPDQRYQKASDLVTELERIGLHNDRLSFIAAGGSRPPAPRPTAATTAVKAKQKTVDDAKAKPGAKVAAAPAKKAPPIDPNIWFLQYTDAAGKPVKAKADTNRVKLLLAKKQLNETVEASHSPKGPFRKLQTYPEFEPLLRVAIAQKVANTKSGATGEAMGDLLANIDKEQARHKRKKKLDHLLTWVWSTILTIAVLGGGGGALWKFVLQPAFQGTQASSNELQQKIEQEKKNMGR